MATGLQREVRRVTLTRLKAVSALTDLVAATSIFGQAVPPEPNWPFVKLGPPQSLPLRAGETDGALVTFPVHAFAKPRLQNGQVVETAEDHAGRIGAGIEAALDRYAEARTGGGRFSFLLTEAQLMSDPDEPEAFHYFAVISARVIAP